MGPWRMGARPALDRAARPGDAPQTTPHTLRSYEIRQILGSNTVHLFITT